MSLDKTEQEFKSYFSTMPWIAHPYDKSSISSKGQSLGIKGIPALLVMKADGTVGSSEGRKDVTSGKSPSEVYDEWYKFAKPKYVQFSGEGVKMGGGKTGGIVDLNQGKIMLDENKPKTKIRIRLHNNAQKVVEFNVSDRVQLLFDFVNQVAPSKSYELVWGYP